MGGSCINTEVEHLDVYRRGWQVLSLDKALIPAERGFLETFSVRVCQPVLVCFVFCIPISSYTASFSVSQCF